jgi:type II secretory pathway pseudopilin PulG
MNNKILVLALVSIVLASLAGLLVVRNQKRSLETISQVVNSIPTPTENEESSSSPTPSVAQAKKEDNSSLVTNISQITLTMSAPANNSTVTSSKVTVKGKTLAKAEVFANEAEGFADANGNFSLSVALDEGVNDIIITAVDTEGNVAETVLTVTYNAGE